MSLDIGTPLLFAGLMFAVTQFVKHFLQPLLDKVKPNWRETHNFISVSFLLFMALAFGYVAQALVFDPLAMDKIIVYPLKDAYDKAIACNAQGGYASFQVGCFDSRFYEGPNYSVFNYTKRKFASPGATPGIQ